MSLISGLELPSDFLLKIINKKCNISGSNLWSEPLAHTRSELHIPSELSGGAVWFVCPMPAPCQIQYPPLEPCWCVCKESRYKHGFCFRYSRATRVGKGSVRKRSCVWSLQFQGESLQTLLPGTEVLLLVWGSPSEASWDT